MAELLNEDETQTMKAAAFGAVFLVANADPGFFNVLRESFAASGALASSRGLVKQVLTTGRLPKLPKSPPNDPGVEASAGAGTGGTSSATKAFVLAALRESVDILAAKVPDELPNFRQTVMDAVDRVASAADGVSDRELAVLAEVREALGA